MGSFITELSKRSHGDQLTVRFHDIQHRSHIKIAEISALYGQPLEPVPFRAVLYMTGHGQNMVKRRGKLDERTEKFLQRQLSPEEAAGVCATFGVPELAASLTRPEE